MPLPSPSPQPSQSPIIGFFGKALDTSGSEYKEQTPDGGYILWRKQGKDDWRPMGYFPPPKGVES